MDIMQFCTGLAGAGVFTVGYKIIELWVKRRNTEAEAAKTEAERDKLDAEAARLQGQTWQETCTWLASSVEKLRGRVTDLEHENTLANNYIKYLLVGIGRLHDQVRASDDEPCWRPEPRNEYARYISPPVGD